MISCPRGGILSPDQLHRNLQDAFNRHDPEAILALYGRDALMVNASGPLQGIDALARPRADGRWVFVIDNPSVPQD